MHISFLTSEYPHERCGNAGGGIGTSIRNLAPELVNLGCKVTVFVYGRSKQREVFDDSGVRIVMIEKKQYGKFTWFMYRKYIATIINEYIVKDKIDIIEAPDWTGVTAFMKLKCPLVIKFHGSDTYFCHLENRKQKWKNRLFESIALRGADGYIPVSKFAKDLTFRLFRLNKSKPCQVIYNGIDIDKFKVADIVNNGNKILYFGTLIRKKGCMEIPYIFNKVIEKHKEIELVLIGADSFDIRTGSSSTWELMKSEFSKHAIERVEYLGKIPYENMRSHINTATICIFPSYAEAFPVSWIEAMACGKALTASNIGWGTESIEDGVSGLLAYPSDHGDYADKICCLLNDKEYAESLGRNARQRVENLFNIRKIACQHISFYESMIKNISTIN